MSSRLQKLNALLKRVEERRAQPRLAAVAPVSAARPAAIPAPAAKDSDLFAATVPPETPTIAPAAASLPPAVPVPAPASLRPEPGERRAPSASPLEDAMAQLGAEDSGPLQVPAPAAPARLPARPSLPDRPSLAEPLVNQDLVLTHRPEAGPLPEGPIVELIQAKTTTPREPTIEFDTGVKANPLTQRDLRPAGLEPMPVELPLSAPTQKVEPLPLLAHAPPAKVVSGARQEAAKTFGELLEQSLSLRPGAR